MRQSILLSMIMLMGDGKAIMISRDDMIEATEGSLSGLDAWMGVRRLDVLEFVEQIQKNWSVRVTESMDGKSWKIFKIPEEIKYECVEEDVEIAGERGVLKAPSGGVHKASRETDGVHSLWRVRKKHGY